MAARGLARRRCALALTTALILTTGCASTNTQPAGSNLAAVSDAPAESKRGLLHGGERGLEVRQWLIADNADLIASVMGRRGDPDVLTGTERERLRRNGLRLVRVPLDALESLEAELGGSTLHNVGWHGQVVNWQEIISRTLPQQRAIAIDGRVRIFDTGRLRLMTRAWLVQMEDGRRLNVQIVPQHFRPAPMSYYRLLGRDTGDGTPIVSMAIDALLDDGYAYVLMCESPMVDWLDVEDDAKSADEKPRSPVAAGPDALPATTVGQLLLRTEHGASRRSGRAVLILVPHVHSDPEPSMVGVLRTLQPADGKSQR